jgi:hypothetical protein
VELVVTDAAFIRRKQKILSLRIYPGGFSLVFLTKVHRKQGECFGSEEGKIIAVFDYGEKKYFGL